MTQILRSLDHLTKQLHRFINTRYWLLIHWKYSNNVAPVTSVATAELWLQWAHQYWDISPTLSLVLFEEIHWIISSKQSLSENIKDGIFLLCFESFDVCQRRQRCHFSLYSPLKSGGKFVWYPVSELKTFIEKKTPKGQNGDKLYPGFHCWRA